LKVREFMKTPIKRACQTGGNTIARKVRNESFRNQSDERSRPEVV
jgi:hypothetical protein